MIHYVIYVKSEECVDAIGQELEPMKFNLNCKQWLISCMPLLRGNVVVPYM